MSFLLKQILDFEKRVLARALFFVGPKNRTANVQRFAFLRNFLMVQ